MSEHLTRKTVAPLTRFAHSAGNDTSLGAPKCNSANLSARRADPRTADAARMGRSGGNRRWRFLNARDPSPQLRCGSPGMTREGSEGSGSESKPGFFAEYVRATG